jgi:hypothetical protein
MEETTQNSEEQRHHTQYKATRKREQMVGGGTNNGQKKFFYRRRKKAVKKKKKPLTMKKFFPTLKNSQGFDLHLCRYEDSIRDHVFVPKNYGQLSRHRVPHQFCNDCKLKPCITIEHQHEMLEIQYEEHKAHDQAREAGKKVRQLTAVNRSERRMAKIMSRHFGRDYANKAGVPNCIIKEAHSYYEMHKKEREEEEASCCCCSCSCSDESGDKEEDDHESVKDNYEAGVEKSEDNEYEIDYEIGLLEDEESSDEENEFV